MTRILLVEDSPADAKLVVHELRRVDPAVEVERVETAEALQAALAAGAWDAVISDWAVPGFSALEALAIVRATANDVPFIIVSGTIGEELAVEAMRAGAHDYVLKDKLARLAPAIEREIRESRLRADHRRQEARFRALIEKSAEAVLLTGRDAAIGYASPAASSIFGRSTEELVGKRTLDFVHPEDRERVVSMMASVRGPDHVVGTTVEFRLVRPDGAVRCVAATGTNLLDDPSVGAVVANMRDVTDTLRAAEELRAAQARFSRLSESGVIGIITADVHGKILDANDAYANMIGYPREALVSGEVGWASLIPPDLYEVTARASAELVERGVVASFESAAIHKNGTRVPMLVGLAMLEYPVTIAFAVDLSEKKRAEQELRKTEEQLRQAQKMEAIGRLAGGIAHDFNNVLSVVLSYAEMLLADLTPDDLRHGDVQEIFRAGQRAADLTRQLLMFSRQEVVEPKVLDLNELMASVDKMLQRLLGEDVELVTCAGVQLGKIRADPSSIEQVVMNLVVNARDAMPTGGKLTIETTNVVLDDDYVRTHVGTHPGPHVLLAVTDTGIGMDAATKARIFEPFFTTKPKEKGTGLGLSTVFGIVHQAGGSIWVYSEPGMGTTFKVYLPCIEGTIATSRSRVAAPAGGTETILLVEDESQVRVVARGILRRQGYTVIEAARANEAIKLCEQHAGEIHLLLTDVVMPQMGGPALATHLQQLRPTMKVLCMSGYTDDSVVRHGILSSDIAFLQKPFTTESLARKVREVLDEARGGR